MLSLWISIRESAERYGLPCLQLTYPRGPAIKNIYNVEVVRYGVRITIESSTKLISGGPQKRKPIDFLEDVKNVMDVGT